MWLKNLIDVSTYIVLTIYTTYMHIPIYLSSLTREYLNISVRRGIFKYE